MGAGSAPQRDLALAVDDVYDWLRRPSTRAVLNPPWGGDVVTDSSAYTGPSGDGQPERRRAGSLLTEILIRVGAWRRGARFGGSSAFAYADPPVTLERWAMEHAVPPYEPTMERNNEALNRVLSEVDLPPLQRRAWMWTLALDDAVRRSELRQRIHGVREASYGLVADGQAVSLAVIFYVSRSRLMQAAPLSVLVEGVPFPVVLRALPTDVEAGAPWVDGGRVTCRALLQGRSGTLTAAHVLGGDNSIRPGDRVPGVCCGSACIADHHVLTVDPIMDAVLVEDCVFSDAGTTVSPTPVPGWFPIEMESPTGHAVPGHVIEVSIPEGVIPGELGNTPSSPALVLVDVVGAPGWSGTMVKETLYRDMYGGRAEPRPYGMFVGVRQLRTGPRGRVHLLRQLELVWNLQLLTEREDHV